MGRGQTHKQTLRLLDQLGPEGQVGEQNLNKKKFALNMTWYLKVFNIKIEQQGGTFLSATDIL